MLRIVLLLAALTFTKGMAEDGTSLVTSYMRINWAVAKSDYAKREAANLKFGCSGNTFGADHADIISVSQDFLASSLSYAASVKASGKTLNQAVLLDSLETFKALFIGAITTKVCSMTIPTDKETSDQISSLFDLTGLQLAALIPTGIRRPQPRSAFVRAAPNVDFLGRRLAP